MQPNQTENLRDLRVPAPCRQPVNLGRVIQAACLLLLATAHLAKQAGWVPLAWSWGGPVLWLVCDTLRRFEPRFVASNADHDTSDPIWHPGRVGNRRRPPLVA